jgi:hypothetical protein
VDNGVSLSSGVPDFFLVSAANAAVVLSETFYVHRFFSIRTEAPGASIKEKDYGADLSALRPPYRASTLPRHYGRRWCDCAQYSCLLFMRAVSETVGASHDQVKIARRPFRR